MSRLTKNEKAVIEKYDQHKLYTLAEACGILKDITYTKFDSTVEITANLGVDPRKANQMIRGVVTLPNGTGKVVRVLALCTPDKEEEAKAAGADYVGLDEYIEKIKGGKIDFKVDKTGIVHTGIGKISFTPEQIYQNAAEVLNAISKLKPQALKGTYMKSCAVATTMSPGVKVDLKAFLNGAE